MERPPPDDPFAPDAPSDEDDPTSPSADDLGGGPRGLIPEAVKKAILAGVGAVFMTEEGARRLARDWKLPKDVIAFVGQQAQSAKDEILRALGDEIRRFLQSDLVRRDLMKALAENTIEVKMEIRFKPDAAGHHRPDVKTAARRKRSTKREPK
jgi:prophage DNA circulation protein